MLIKYNMVDPYRSWIWNIDGSGIDLGHKKPKHLLISTYNKHDINKELMTVIVAVNTDGRI